jgi:predicted acyltransferase
MSSDNKIRIQSIDIFRALTMFFMIFVNDFWTLVSYPTWLGHMPADKDALGFSDVIFPAFLFIVGLSIPFAVRARRKKGDSNGQLVWHIVQRSFALIVMGVLMVNLENINNEALIFDKGWWQILMTLSFFLVWNVYPNKLAMGKIPSWVMMVTGWAIIAFLVIVYKGGSTDSPSWIEPHWWGILGLIGWAYLLCSMIYVFVGDKLWAIGLSLVVLCVLNVFEFIDGFSGIMLVVSASNYALVMSGVFATVFFIRLKEAGNERGFIISIFLLGILSLAFGFITRPEWGISKIYATPSWTSICAGISFLVYLILYIITDKFQLVRWSNILLPAGRSTLTCYLVPYFYYAIIGMLGLSLPDSFLTGWIGIMKSLLFAMLIIQITWVLERLRIRLKI